MISSLDNDGLFLLAEGLSGYLAEIAACRAVCLRHESTATVWLTTGVLHVQRLFDPAPATAARLAARVEEFPGWEGTLFWPSEGERWERFRVRAAARGKEDPNARPAALRGIAWEGRPVLVNIRSRGSGAPIVVETAMPSLPLDLPELPLRLVASGLRCHEDLLPGYLAAPLPLAKHGEGRSHLRDYLERATPQNRYASQCFSQRSAGK